MRGKKVERRREEEEEEEEEESGKRKEKSGGWHGTVRVVLDAGSFGILSQERWLLIAATNGSMDE